MRKVLLFLSLAVFALGMQAKDKDEFRYEVVSAGVGSEGIELIKVYSYAKNQKKAIEAGKKNAVHAVLFKGIPASAGNYVQNAMVKASDYETHKEFFDEFFKSGKYLQFVTLSSDGAIAPSDMLRVGKEYKIGIIFSVNKNTLRKYMEDMGVCAALGGMFD